jgi:hypothetical protein
MILLSQLSDAEGSSALARLAEPWNALYSDSKVVSATVIFLHLVPLLLAGGAALSADRATLRAARGGADDRTRHLRDLSRVHALVLGGLALSFVSGVLLFLADVDEFLGSPLFWVKLAFVGMLLLNGFVMTRTERSLATGGDETTLWARLRTVSVLSQLLWITTTLAGVLLMTYA